MIYYTDVIKTLQNNAAKKAPTDIARICRDMGMEAISLPAIPYDKSVVFQRIWMMTVWARALLKMKRIMKEGDTLLIQHPLYGTRLLERILPEIKRKGVKLIALIHDLNLIRGATEGQEVTDRSVCLQDSVILKMMDSIICHNDHMSEFLANQGFIRDRLVSLEIFDYLFDKRETEGRDSEKNQRSMVIAGNLSPEKSKYIYELANSMQKYDSCRLYLYGNGFSPDTDESYKNVSYMGSVLPDDLPNELNYDFGIVWDGESISSCTGNTGEYLKFNNPHKASLYLASGLPVIVWTHAAIADFILSSGVGIAVESLEDVGNVIEKVSAEEYARMKENVIQVSEKLRNGYYFRTALEEAIKRNEI